MSKRILVTGATGFVGSHLLDLLLETEPKAQIYALKRLNSSLRNVEHIKNKVAWFDGDLCDAHSMNVIIACEPHEIYHLGACSWVSPSWSMPSVYMQTNAIGTINLFEAILNRPYVGEKPKVLVSCTPEEYGDVKPENLPITEESLIAPVNPYAASKVAQDAVCQSYFASCQIPIIRTRAFNHEGPRRDKHGALASFAYQIVRMEAGLQRPVIQVGSLSATRNFTDVRDMVKAYQLAMKLGIPGELYLIGSQNIYTIQECLEKLIALSYCREICWKVDQKRVRPTELNYLIGDCSKFEKLTGWKPEISFDDMLQGILDYWRQRIYK